MRSCKKVSRNGRGVTKSNVVFLNQLECLLPEVKCRNRQEPQKIRNQTTNLSVRLLTKFSPMATLLCIKIEIRRLTMPVLDITWYRSPNKDLKLANSVQSDHMTWVDCDKTHWSISSAWYYEYLPLPADTPRLCVDCDITTKTYWSPHVCTRCGGRRRPNECPARSPDLTCIFLVRLR